MESKTIQPDHCLPAAAEGTVGQRRSYLGEVFRSAFALFGSVRSRGRPGGQDDGLDALDMLGGWEGSASRRRRKR